MPPFFCKVHGHHRDLPSSPPRRSSDPVPAREGPRRGGGRPPGPRRRPGVHREARSEEHTSELQSRLHLVCRLFFVKYTATTEISPLPLHAALPIPFLRARALAEEVGDRRALADALACIGKLDRKSTRLNSSHGYTSYAAFFL